MEGGLMVWLWTLSIRVGALYWNTRAVDTFAQSRYVVSAAKPGHVATDAKAEKHWIHNDHVDNYCFQPVAIEITSVYGKSAPRSTQPPLAPAASRLQYGRRRNANALPERGHIQRIEPILAIIAVEKLLIFQPKWVIYMSNITFCLIKTCAQISNSLLKSVNLSTFAQH